MAEENLNFNVSLSHVSEKNKKPSRETVDSKNLINEETNQEKSVQKIPDNPEIILKIFIESSNKEIQVTGLLNSESSEKPEDSNESHFKFWPLPFSMFLISFFQIVVYSFCQGNIEQWKYDPSKRHEVWRFLTYAFVHKEFDHLLGNLIAQCILGTWLELVQGSWRTTTVYLSGAVTGAIFHSIGNPANALIGASGGVYALFAANFPAIIMNWNETKGATLQIFFFLVIGITDVVSAVFSDSGSVSNMAHLGGSIGGFLIEIIVLKVFNKKLYYEKLGRLAVTVYLASLIHGAFYRY